MYCLVENDACDKKVFEHRWFMFISDHLPSPEVGIIFLFCYTLKFTKFEGMPFLSERVDMISSPKNVFNHFEMFQMWKKMFSQFF